MTTTVGYAALQIVPSVKGFGASLGSQVSPAMGSVGTAAGGRFRTGFLGSIRGIAGPLAATMGIAAVGGFVKSSIGAASDLNESLNAVNVTFGKNAEGIMALGESAATSLGLSNNEFNSLAVRFSSFTRTVAGKGGDVVGVMDDLTTRASDFASVMNLDVAEAAAVFQSGLAGETEPLKRYGIDLSAAAVENYALAQGIAKSGEELTEQQKVQARYGLLMKATSKTQGDFANTSGGLANATRIAKAAFTDLQASIGAAVLPALAGMMSFVAQRVVPGIQGLYDLIVKGDFTGAFAQAFGIAEDSPIVPRLLEIRDTIIDVFQTILSAGKTIGGALLSGFQSIVGFMIQWRDVLLPIAAAIGAVVVAMKVWNTLMMVATAVGKAYAVVQALINAVMSANPIGLIVLAITGLIAALVVVYQRSEAFRNVVQTVWGAIKTAVGAAMSFIVPIVTRGWQLIVKAFDWLRTYIWPVVQKYLALISTVWRNYVKVWWTVIKVAFNIIKTIITTVLKVVVPIIKKWLTVAKVYFQVVWKAVTTVVKVAWGLIKSIITTGVRIIMNVINGIRAIVGFVSNIFSNVVSTISGWIDKAVEKVTGLKDRVLNFFSGAINWLYDVGVDMIQGLIDGAGSLLSKIGEFFLDKLPGWMVGPFKAALGIESPSKVFIALGKNVIEGLAKGLADGDSKRAIDQSMNSIVDQVGAAADRIVDRVRAAGQEMVSFGRDIATAVRDTGALTVGDGITTAAGITSDLASRVADAKQFGKYLIRLKRLGLNNASLQQIIAAGPMDGGQIAKALLTDGERAIRQVNRLETQLARSSRTIANVGVESQFGKSISEARAMAGAKVTVDEGAVQINFAGDPGRDVRRQVRLGVEEAWDEIERRLERREKRMAQRAKSDART